jgi:dTDP-4-amino-4,6-dideoxygalactose transaminase
MIPFNKPYMTGQELAYIADAVAGGKISGDGVYTKKCHALLERTLGRGRAFLTSSCTDALEAAALLCDLKPGDEVILPSYTFVSTANAFALRGAQLRFIDSLPDHPNMDTGLLESLVTPRTRVIVPVHYAGMACDMDTILGVAERHRLRVVEDAAQAIDSYFRGQALGTFGDAAAFSFHETKNIISGEGGSLHVNDPALVARAEIVREKGTNRSSFFRGEIDKYGWVDIGSSFLASDITAAFLYAQLESLADIQARRRVLWDLYADRLQPLERSGHATLPRVPLHATNNSHMFYLVCGSLEARSGLIASLKQAGIMAVFHYQSLHKSSYFSPLHDGRQLPHADRYTDCLVRLPLFYELSENDVHRICDVILRHFGTAA